jgi:molecular chaperone IbpA
MTYIKDVFGRDLYPFTVGFDKTFDTLRTLAENGAKAVGYPPYNIKKLKDDKYVIEMAVAGFSKSDIEVTLEGNKLTVTGDTKNTTEDNEYLYQGIANRGFNRTFTLGDKIEIKDAEIVNGMLRIWLENMIKAQDMVKKIAVKDPK